MKKHTILIVDDTPLNIQAMVHILQSEYDCIVATSGADALMLAKKAKPNLILLDILMPDMDGYETLAALQKMEETKDTPVIIVTGLGDIANEEQGLALGAADYIHRSNSAAVIKLRVRKQLQLIGALKDAEEASRAKSDFLAKMSHEIRTPMNAVIGITTIQLQKGGFSQEVEDAFLQIRTSSDMLLSLINDVLDLSKMAAGKMEVSSMPYDTVGMIIDTARLHLAQVKNIDFHLDADENLPSSLIGDEIRIKQILNNLLSNAFKYTAEGEVKLHVKTEGEQLQFSVYDTGRGMTTKQVDSLFNSEYIRFDESANIQGTGLGLNIVHKLVVAMNGTIKVDSTPGKGTAFHVNIPQKIENPLPIGKEQAQRLADFRFSNADLRKHQYFEYEPMPYGKLLVVDDIESNLFVARGLLEPYQIMVDTAESGAEAISRVKNGAVYDIIFMDHMMPDMDGIEAAKQIREMGYTNPIVALTANIIAGQSEIFDETDFNGFISKPIDLNIINSYLVRFVRDKYSEKATRLVKVDSALWSSGASNAVIESFLRDAKRVRDILAKFIENQELSELSAFTINAHGIKSALANVGEIALSEQAKALEEAGRTANMSEIFGNTPGFLTQLDGVMQKLSAQLASEQHSAIADISVLCEKIKLIIEACNEYDPDKAFDLLDELKKSKWESSIAETLGEISQNLLHGDYTVAADFAKKLL